MKFYALLMLGAALSSAAVSNVFGQAPVNDDFEDAIDLGSEVNFTVNGSTVNATTQGEGMLFEVGGNRNSVWWKWTVPAEGTYTFSTVGSDFDAYLYVFSEDEGAFFSPPSEGSLMEIDSNDDEYEDQAQVEVEFHGASVGEEFYIMVRGSDGDEGTVRLSVLKGENVRPYDAEHILLRNTVNGQLATWGMDFDYEDGFELDEGGVLSPTFLPTSWGLIQHASTWSAGPFEEYQQVLLHGPRNQLVYWALAGSVVGYGVVPTPAAGGGGVWRLCGFVDTADEDPNSVRDNDLVWQNTITGQIAIWLMDDEEAFTSAAVVTPLAGGANEVKIVGSTQDVLWLQNKFNGTLYHWNLDGAFEGLIGLEESSVVSSSPGPAWELLGSDDFSGAANLYFRNRFTGQGASWELDSPDENVSSASFWQISPPASWEMVPSSMFRLKL